MGEAMLGSITENNGKKNNPEMDECEGQMH